MRTDFSNSIFLQNVVFGSIKWVSLLFTVVAWCDAHASEEAPIKYPSDVRPVDPTSEFARLNPEYKRRVGLFYETEYLPTALDQLSERLKFEPKQKKIAAEILRSFIYDLLTAKIRDNGQITVEHLKAAIAAMDAKFSSEIPKNQFKAYIQWRDDVGGGNAMGFLTASTLLLRQE